MSGFDLNNEDVVSTGMSDPTFAFGLGATFQSVELINAARQVTGFSTPPLAFNQWFTESGVKCKILRVEGGGWQSGKIRFRLEFIPDKPVTIKEHLPKASENPMSLPGDLQDEVLGLTEIK